MVDLYSLNPPRFDTFLELGCDMYTLRRRRILAALVLATVVVSPSARAEVTPDQAKQLRELKSELGQVATLLRKKEYEEAEKTLDEIESKVRAIIDEADVQENDRRLQGVPQLIASRRKSLQLQTGKAVPGAGGVSFVDDVAPVVSENCLGCHGADNPRANLRLDTFAGWKRGGRSGRLLTPGTPGRSLILARLTASNQNQRMPRGSGPLERDEINTIAKWISGGAKFDGDAETTGLRQLRKKADAVKIMIPKPKGTETVSFTKDVAPMIVRLCLNCHSGNNPASGLSLTSFANMMRGGDSGEVIIPGDRENSRLFRLVGGLENPRMPQSQARIRRQEYEDLVAWFNEGNAYDGQDPEATLVSYVPTEEQLAAARFESMPAAEFLAHRKEQAEGLWKRTLPNDPFKIVESEQFLVVGDVPEERLRQIDDWASAHAENLKRTSNVKDDLLWNGKLAILVFKERFGMTEYALTQLNLDAPEGMYGHSQVTATHSDAYVVLQDVGDVPNDRHPGLKANLIDHLTGAFLQRGGPLPEWLVRGAGLSLAAQDQPGIVYFRQLPKQALAACSSLTRSRDLFAEGTFSPAAAGPVGFAVVEYLTNASGKSRLSQLVQRLQGGDDLADAVQAVYRTTLEDLGQAFTMALRRSVR